MVKSENIELIIKNDVTNAEKFDNIEKYKAELINELHVLASMKGICRKEYITDEILLNVSLYGKSLEYIPYEYRNYDICYKFVSRRGSNLDYVPAKLLDENICYMGMKKNYFDYHSFKYLLNTSIVKKYIKRNPRYLTYVPNKFITEELLIYYIKTSVISTKCIRKIRYE